MVTDNWCPAGIIQMRRAYPVTTEITVQKDGRKHATCSLCNRPRVPVSKDPKLGWVYSGHKESNLIGGVTESGRSYSKVRKQNW